MRIWGYFSWSDFWCIRNEKCMWLLGVPYLKTYWWERDRLMEVLFYLFRSRRCCLRVQSKSYLIFKINRDMLTVLFLPYDFKYSVIPTLDYIMYSKALQKLIEDGLNNTKFLEDIKMFLSVVYIDKYYPLPLFLLRKKVKESWYTLRLLLISVKVWS